MTRQKITKESKTLPGGSPIKEGALSIRRYQQESNFTAIYPGRKREVVVDHTICRPGLDYVCKGLCGEVGELMEHLKKNTRDEGGVLKPMSERKYLIFQEIGDIAWYLSQICEELDISLEAALLGNVFKLEARMKKGTIKGSGDKR